MQVLVLGCGAVGEVAVRDLHSYGRVDRLVVGARDPDRVSPALADLAHCGPRICVERIDVSDSRALVGLMSGADAVINCVGPNYQHELAVARAAIAARVHLVDLNDEFETTMPMLDLDAEARAAGITVVLGLGASPGISNVLARAGAKELDDVEEIHTAWAMSASDPGGTALAYHLLHSLSGGALTWRDGELVEVRSFVDGRERVRFPWPVGDLDVFHIGHPEPITLSRAFPSVQCVDDKATFKPAVVNEWIVSLGLMAWEAKGTVQVDGCRLDALDFAAAYLQRKLEGLADLPKQGALRVEVKGRRGRRHPKVSFACAGRLASATGAAASIGALMLAQGAIDKRGVLPPEDCIDPDAFLHELFDRRGVAKLDRWVTR